METAAEARITAADMACILEALGEQGKDDLAWSESLLPPASAEDFATEAIWILCNSGMKHSVARIIQSRVLRAISDERPVSEAFRHPGKAAAMQDIWDHRERYFRGFLDAADKIAYLATLPWIGGITKFHLAKNCGIDCAKPDVHLQRLADREGTTVHEMCSRLARETGYRVATIDVLLWRACATGVVDSRTGARKP